MTVADLVSQAGERLTPMYSPREAKLLALRLAEHYEDMSPAVFYSCGETELRSSDRLVEALGQLSEGRPIQYVLGYAEFCGHRFKVREGCLIPRPETEELVGRIVSDCQGFVTGDGQFNVLDMCTGSGCIAYSLAAAFPQAMVYGCDISEDALSIACRQRIKLSGARPVLFRADVTCPPPAGLPEFDIIVSNPPYIKESQRAEMHRNVLGYEPAEALFVPDDDPLVFYRAVKSWADLLLKRGGTVYLEVNESLADETAGIFPGSCVEKDFNSKPRFVISRS